MARVLPLLPRGETATGRARRSPLRGGGRPRRACRGAGLAPTPRPGEASRRGERRPRQRRRRSGGQRRAPSAPCAGAAHGAGGAQRAGSGGGRSEGGGSGWGAPPGGARRATEEEANTAWQGRPAQTACQTPDPEAGGLRQYKARKSGGAEWTRGRKRKKVGGGGARTRGRVQAFTRAATQQAFVKCLSSQEGGA